MTAKDNAEYIAAAANAAVISGQGQFLEWAKNQEIECAEYDEDGIELFGDADGHFLHFEVSEGWVHSCPGGC